MVIHNLCSWLVSLVKLSISPSRNVVLSFSKLAKSECNKAEIHYCWGSFKCQTKDFGVDRWGGIRGHTDPVVKIQDHAGADLLSRVAGVFCIFLKIAALWMRALWVTRLLGIMELPQAITEMCLCVVSCSDHLHSSIVKWLEISSRSHFRL